jgi:hypothetical protein
MNPPTDELRQLWQSGPGNGGVNQRELLHQLEQRTRRFDRTIWFRDLRETAAGLLITVVYLWFALHAGSMLERVADLWLAACGVWIASFLLRYSRLSRKPAPEQTLAVYRRELVERYDRQIRLSKSVKYWYVLPLWAGLMLSEAAHLMNGLDKTRILIVVVFVTLCSAGVWWLNEGPGIRYLERKRRELTALIGEEGVSK